ncbi:hypothetical protein SCHPADRAFT_934991 [Schizopora paradoxa]|uniref:Pre-rRNA-processing protein RIX1 n=1 Tax=Schizopora paradoxa TaxID=27342 RepID=A0A0H2SRV9_9AGAM|nr:hypothetical protein SCHPADRAFT_934991 [Schizopora paradoxa]
MDSNDILHTFLQTYLSDDALSVTFLPAILSGLSSCDVENSTHLSKWVNRVNSLIHSKDAGIRWAGLCLALKTSQLARSVLLSSGQAWVAAVIPLLSKADNPVTYKAAIRLLTYIFTTTTDLSEFQRQVVTPNVPKFSNALISLTEKFADLGLKIYCMDVLSVLVQKFSTLHRPLAPQLSSLSLSFLNGSPASPTPKQLTKSACRLHACLHNTGGKVGGSALWRKSMDETIDFCNEALNALRSDPSNSSQYADDPMVFTNVNLDRLNCGVELLCCLLCTSVSRPVLVPVKSLVSLCTELMNAAASKEISNDIDPSFTALAVGTHVYLLEMACRLTSVLSACVGKRLGPEHSKILSILAFNLERTLPTRLKIPLVRLLPALLGPCFHPADPLVAGRIIKSLLPTLARTFSQKSPAESPSSQVKGNKKAKRRVQGYEGDEVFKTGSEVIFSSPEEGELILHTVDALPYLLRTADLPEYLQSLTSRLLLSLLVVLPTVSASSVSNDLTLHGKILSRVKDITLELCSASGSILSKSLPVVVTAIGSEIDNRPQARKSIVHERLIVDLMLHPRLPPLLRPLPRLNEIALTSKEEGEEEKKTREAIGLTDVHASSTREMLVTNSSANTELEIDSQATAAGRAVDKPSHATVMDQAPPSDSGIHLPFTAPTQRPQEQPKIQVEEPNIEGIKAHSMEVEMRAGDLKGPLESQTHQMPHSDAKDPSKLGTLAEEISTVKTFKTPPAHDSMVVDDDDDDGDIVIPPLSMASDSDSDE